MGQLWDCEVVSLCRSTYPVFGSRDDSSNESPFYYIESVTKPDSSLSNKVYLFGEVSDSSSSEVVKKLFDLDDSDDVEEIEMLINSEGGVVSGALSIIHAMKSISKPVRTIVTGCAYSCASLIAINGDYRECVPYSMYMIHSTSYEELYSMNPGKLSVLGNQLTYLNNMQIDMFSKLTKIDIFSLKESINSGMELYLTSEQALSDGLVDKVCTYSKKQTNLKKD